MKEQVIELAKQAGASRYTNRHYPDRPTHTFTVEQLETYTALVRNAAPKAFGPLKWSPEEIEDGMRGIRWVMPEGVFGRPTDHDVREYLQCTETARGCQCDDCNAFYEAPKALATSREVIGRYMADRGFYLSKEALDGLMLKLEGIGGTP